MGKRPGPCNLKRKRRACPCNILKKGMPSRPVCRYERALRLTKSRRWGAPGSPGGVARGRSRRRLCRSGPRCHPLQVWVAQLLRGGTLGLRRALRAAPPARGARHWVWASLGRSACNQCAQAQPGWPGRGTALRQARLPYTRATCTRRGARRQDAGGSTRSGMIKACMLSPGLHVIQRDAWGAAGALHGPRWSIAWGVSHPRGGLYFGLVFELAGAEICA